MEGLDNVKSILTGFNGMAQKHSDALADAARAGDTDAMQAALDGILEAHRIKEEYTRDLVRRVVAVQGTRLPSLPS
jgi:hypothetical protein